MNLWIGGTVVIWVCGFRYWHRLNMDYTFIDPTQLLTVVPSLSCQKY